MSTLRLVIFDVDGTLVDSQADILAAMTHAFVQAGKEAPSREAVLSIVGLSLDRAIALLAPDLPAETHDKMVEWYKEAYVALRAKIGATQSSPLYPGALQVLETLQAQPETLLGVATGKSRRGLDKLLEAHGMERMFITQQVSDHHPSKPHPSMIRQALTETGLEAHQAVMIGDTSFDMEMAAAAGVAGIGVSWGYHAREALSRARHVIDRFEALPPLLKEIWEISA